LAYAGYEVNREQDKPFLKLIDTFSISGGGIRENESVHKRTKRRIKNREQIFLE
jgi:hypothetical protein